MLEGKYYPLAPVPARRVLVLVAAAGVGVGGGLVVVAVAVVVVVVVVVVIRTVGREGVAAAQVVQGVAVVALIRAVLLQAKLRPAFFIRRFQTCSPGFGPRSYSVPEALLQEDF